MERVVLVLLTAVLVQEVQEQLCSFIKIERD
jgi:hypothetical protein